MAGPTRLLLGTVGLLAGMILVGIIGVGIGEAVPDRFIGDRLHDAVLDGTLTPTAQARTRDGNISDHFTECIGISMGLGEESGAGFLETMAESPHLGPCDRLVPAIEAYGGSGSFEIGRPYLRYWHGYSAVTRPLLALFGVTGLRMAGFLALVASMLAVAMQVRQRAGSLGALALLGPLLATSDLHELPGAATQSLATAVGFAGAAATLAVAGSAPTGLTVPRVWVVTIMAGAAFVYVDILTIVPGMWILPAALVALVARSEGADARGTLGWTLLAGLGWIVGYLGMWFGKWFFAALVLGAQRVTDDVRETIDERLSGDSAFVEDGIARATRRNLDFWYDRPLALPVLWVALLVVVVVVVSLVARRDWPTLAAVAVAAAPALIPFIWFEVANNHSQIHHWFTYRSLPIALGVVLLAVATPTGRAPQRGRTRAARARSHSAPATQPGR